MRALNKEFGFCGFNVEAIDFSDIFGKKIIVNQTIQQPRKIDNFTNSHCQCSDCQWSTANGPH
jgi:hypothetical protein